MIGFQPVVEEAPSTLDEFEDSDIVHRVCECDENISLCGFDLSGWDDVEAEDDDNVCWVCEDLGSPSLREMRRTLTWKH